MRGPYDIGHEVGQSVAARGPRAAGLVMFGVSVGLLGLEAVLVASVQRVYLAPLVLGGALAPASAWTFLTNRSWHTPENPTWWKVVHTVSTLAGGAAGIVAWLVLTGT